METEIEILYNQGIIFLAALWSCFMVVNEFVSGIRYFNSNDNSKLLQNIIIFQCAGKRGDHCILYTDDEGKSN